MCEKSLKISCCFQNQSSVFVNLDERTMFTVLLCLLMFIVFMYLGGLCMVFEEEGKFDFGLFGHMCVMVMGPFVMFFC